MVKTSDEKYLRAIYHLIEDNKDKVSLSELAYYLDLKPLPCSNAFVCCKVKNGSPIKKQREFISQGPAKRKR
ncbi:MAG: hypothetical protein IPJ32_12895 [Sphingobacteriaceae bacterium]|nr:hypothetical protein [Sphingobacteriaceae bacterium]